MAQDDDAPVTPDAQDSNPTAAAEALGALGPHTTPGPTMSALPTPDPDEPVDRADVIGEGGRWLAAWAGRFLLIALALAVVGWTINQFSAGILPVVLALLLTSVLWPATKALKKIGVPYALGAAISLLGGVGIIVGIFAAIAPSIARQWPILAAQAVEGVRQLQDWLAGPPLNLQDEQLDQWITQGLDYLQAQAGSILSSALSFGGSVGNVIMTLLLMMVLSFFFLKDGVNFLGWTRKLVGRRAGFHAAELLTRLWTTVSGYIRTQAIVSFVDALFIGIGLVIIGVPLAFPLAVITFMAGFIPIVGAVSAGALAVLVAMVSNGFYASLMVLGVILLVQQLESNVLQPLLQSKVMHLHAVVVLLAVLLGGGWFGIIGAFLAVPVAASLAVVFRYLGELTDLRTGERTTEDIVWATAEGQYVGNESERAAQFFRSLVKGRRHGEAPAATDAGDGDTAQDPGHHSWRERVKRFRP